MKSNAARLLALGFAKAGDERWVHPHQEWIVELRRERAYRHSAVFVVGHHFHHDTHTFMVTHWRLYKRGALTATLRAPNLQALLKKMEALPALINPGDRP